MIVDKMSFRRAHDEEIRIIKDFLTTEFNETCLDAFCGYDFWLKDGKIMEVFAIPCQLSNFILFNNLSIYFAGIPVGSIKRNKFQLEIEGGTFLRPYISKKIFVKTDQYLYGKTIHKSNIAKIEGEFARNDVVIIIGKNNLDYGVGRVRVDSSKINSLPSNYAIITGKRHVPLDRGWYLRRGG